MVVWWSFPEPLRIDSRRHTGNGEGKLAGQKVGEARRTAPQSQFPEVVKKQSRQKPLCLGGRWCVEGQGFTANRVHVSRE